MKRKLSILFVLLLLIPLFFINISAKSETIADGIADSNKDFRIDDNKEFNYLFVNDDKLMEAKDKIYSFPTMDNIVTSMIKMSFDLGNDRCMDIVYLVNNKVVEYVYYSIDDEVFLLITKDGIEYTPLDLRGDDDKVYSLDLGKATIEGANVSLLSHFIHYVGFDYIYGIVIKEKNFTYSYYNQVSLTIDDLKEQRQYTDMDYIFMIGEYDDNTPGFYDFYICYLVDKGILYLYHYFISIYDERSIACDYVKVSYKEPITLIQYRDNYIHGYDLNFNKNEYRITSDYFYGYSKIIGTYGVSVKYDKDAIIISSEGIIEVIDDIPPIIKGDGQVNDNLSSKRDIYEYLSSYKATDEIDGDLSDRIVISDLDDYDNNLDKGGTFRFLLECTDNSGNKSKKTVKYIVNDDIEREDVEPTQTTDNPSEEVASTPSSTRDQVIIEYTIKANTNKHLTMDELKGRLKFYGLIPDNYDGEIISDYFGNEDTPGEYQILVEDEGKHYYSLIVEASKESGVTPPKSNVDSNMILIIILSSIGGVLLIVIAILAIILIKKKLNKHN